MLILNFKKTKKYIFYFVAFQGSYFVVQDNFELVAETGLELLILLLLPSKCWDYRFVPPSLVVCVLRQEFIV